MICDNCKKFFVSGNRPSGIPNGVKMILKGNKSITLCADCIMNIGAMNDEQKDEFFEQLKGKERTEKEQ